MKLLKDTYENMLFGIAIFVGGMIAVVLLMKYLNQPASAQVSPEPIPSVIPMVNPSRQLEKLNESVKSMQPKGEFFTRAFDITDRVYMYRCKREGGLQYHAIDVLNMGPSDVYLSVNTSDMPEAPIQPGHTINIDFKNRGAIDVLYFRCNPGEHAKVYLYIVK